MFQPVGDLPPSVYWRRRFILLAGIVVLIVLIALTISVLSSGGGNGSSKQAAGTSSNSTSGTPTVPGSSTNSSTRPRTSTSSKPQPRSSSRDTSPSRSGASSSVAPQPCVVSALDLSAGVAKSSYAVGDTLDLSILIRNPGSLPCVQDLTDKHIVLTVYNGESRVWGSHDCKIEPGTDKRTLMPHGAVRVTVQWSGQSSMQKGCEPRQQVGAGTYTVYAALDGRQGRAAQFTIR